MPEDTPFELKPRSGRDVMLGILAFPAAFALGGLGVSIENAGTTPWAIPIAAIVCVGVAVFGVWALRRVAPLTLVVDGDELRLTDRRVELCDRRANLRGERGYVQFSGRNTGGVRYPAIAFWVGARRVVAMSSEGSPAVTNRKLWGQVYILAPERFARLAQVLRLT